MARPALLDKLHWYVHDSFRLDGPPVIYLDPFHLPEGSPAADLILVSHDHFDHCSLEDIKRIRRPTTVVVANPSAAAKIKRPVTTLLPGQETTVAGVRIEAVPAYNLDKPFHPREANGIGFVLTVAGERLYFAGDTDLIPEMTGLACDLALLPVGGKYTMTAEEAARAAGTIHPKMAIPMHYGADVIGTRADAETFRRHCSVPVTIFEVDAA